MSMRSGGSSALAREMLANLNVGLERIYGPRLRGVYLFGSHARRRAGRESDLDVLVVLDSVPRYAAEVDRTGELASALSLEHGVSISRVFVSESDWDARRSPFLANVRREAVRA